MAELEWAPVENYATRRIANGATIAELVVELGSSPDRIKRRVYVALGLLARDHQTPVVYPCTMRSPEFQVALKAFEARTKTYPLPELGRLCHELLKACEVANMGEGGVPYQRALERVTQARNAIDATLTQARKQAEAARRKALIEHAEKHGRVATAKLFGISIGRVGQILREEAL